MPIFIIDTTSFIYYIEILGESRHFGYADLLGLDQHEIGK